MVSRGQGPKQRFSWQEALALEMAPGRQKLTVCVSRVLCLVSSCTLDFSDGKKMRRWKGKRPLPRASTDVEKRLAKPGV